MTKRTVRIKIRPNQSIEVGDAEYLDLQRQGLLVADEPETTPESAGKSDPPEGDPRDNPNSPQRKMASLRKQGASREEAN